MLSLTAVRFECLGHLYALGYGVAIECVMTATDKSKRNGADRHHPAGAVAHVDLPDVGNVAAVGCLALYVDLPGAAIQVEVVDVDAAERRLQRGKILGRRGGLKRVFAICL
jgi:hypothetical protein